MAQIFRLTKVKQNKIETWIFKKCSIYLIFLLLWPDSQSLSMILSPPYFTEGMVMSAWWCVYIWHDVLVHPQVQFSTRLVWPQYDNVTFLSLWLLQTQWVNIYAHATSQFKVFIRTVWNKLPSVYHHASGAFWIAPLALIK